MAQDYHIYLHGVGGTELQSKTKPFTYKDSPFKPRESQSVEDNQMTETGAASLSKVAPYVAVAIAVAKVSDKILTTGFAHLSEYTGHYEYEMNYNNFKTALNHVFNPVGYLKQIIHRNAQWNKQNIAIAEERQLLGDTLYKNQKIGV